MEMRGDRLRAPYRVSDCRIGTICTWFTLAASGSNRHTWAKVPLPTGFLGIQPSCQELESRVGLGEGDMGRVVVQATQGRLETRLAM